MVDSELDKRARGMCTSKVMVDAQHVLWWHRPAGGFLADGMEQQ